MSQPTPSQLRRRVKDPLDGAIMAADRIRDLQAQVSQFAAVRAGAVGQLYQEHGATKAAEMLGVSRDRVYSMLRDNGVGTRTATPSGSTDDILGHVTGRRPVNG